MRQEELWVWLRGMLESIKTSLNDMPKINNMGTTTRNAVQTVQLLMEAIRDPRNAPHHLPHWIAHVENLAPVQVRGSRDGLPACKGLLHGRAVGEDCDVHCWR